jgi:asparagine synthase (glutamine-hydrolysing)
MCGITGIYNIRSKRPIEEKVLNAMSEAIRHRGPDDSSATIIEDDLGLGFRRLSIIDLAHGNQPFYSDDNSVVVICNGEIYNHKELRAELEAKGFKLKTTCDIEVLPHLYKVHGIDFVKKLNGQFAICLYDKTKKEIYLVRDHFGICPLFYTVTDETLVFGSEVKAILKHDKVERKVNLTALDQLFTFPGVVSPSTFFENIHSIKAGHFLRVKEGTLSSHEYWDLDYPLETDGYETRSEKYYIDKLEELFFKSVQYRMAADVPVGFYLSGGVDSSLVGAVMKKINPDIGNTSFSICYPNKVDELHDESRYQRLMADYLDSKHHEITFNWSDVAGRLKDAIYYSEGALKESYNTCSLALSEMVRKNNIKVVLSGEGSDELFGGYVGYRFDVQRKKRIENPDLEEMLEAQTRQKLWGDADFFYETNHNAFRETTKAVYSDEVNSRYHQFDCLKNLEIDKSKLEGRHPFHKRSYLDFKLRLSDHLVSDHADRVNYANSIEGRYPFLDVNLIEFIKTIAPDVKLKNLVEKYILKEVAKRHLPNEINTRQKFSWVAPSSSQLLKNNVEWINDMLSSDHIKRMGYFNPETIERLKKIYQKDNFTLNIPYESDLLIVVLTFNIFLEVFDMPAL